MIKLKDILLESPTSVEKTFGKIVFGDPDGEWSDDFASLQNVEPIERNTEEEDEILRILSIWVQDPDDEDPVDNKLYSKFELFKKATNSFPNVFKPRTPNGTELYRGLSRSGKNIITRLENTKSDDYEQFGQNKMYFKFKRPIKYVPHNLVQSWTSNPNVAIEFSQVDSYELGAILITNQNDEFLFNQDALKIFSEEYEEDEVIHFGKEYSDEVYVAIHLKMYRHIIFGEPLK
jgi:hypothetical protein